MTDLPLEYDVKNLGGLSLLLRPALLLIDDHVQVLQMVSRLLEDRFDVTAREDALDIVDEFEDSCPQVVVLDISMPKIDGLAAARRLKARHPEASIVFLSTDSSPDTVDAALQIGGSGYVLKTSLFSDLMPAIDAATAGEQYLSPMLR